MTGAKKVAHVDTCGRKKLKRIIELKTSVMSSKRLTSSKDTSVLGHLLSSLMADHYLNPANQR
jgi:Mg2+ and Co2+ transporter CorA